MNSRLFRAELPDTTLDAFERWILTHLVLPAVDDWPDDPAAAAKLVGELQEVEPEILRSDFARQFIYQSDGMLLGVVVEQVQPSRVLLSASTNRRGSAYVERFIQHLARYWREFRVTYLESTDGFTLGLLAEARATLPDAPAAQSDQASPVAASGLDYLPAEDRKWYDTLLACKEPFRRQEMSWDNIGDRQGVSGRTAKRWLKDLQARGLPGLDDWPERRN